MHPRPGIVLFVAVYVREWSIIWWIIITARMRASLARRHNETVFKHVDFSWAAIFIPKYRRTELYFRCDVIVVVEVDFALVEWAPSWLVLPPSCLTSRRRAKKLKRVDLMMNTQKINDIHQKRFFSLWLIQHRWNVRRGRDSGCRRLNFSVWRRRPAAAPPMRGVWPICHAMNSNRTHI